LSLIKGAQNFWRPSNLLFPKMRKRWLAGLTKQENGQNLQLVCASAAAKPSGQQSANRKSDLLKDQTPSLLFLHLADFRILVDAYLEFRRF
jgi:hypothetical protein